MSLFEVLQCHLVVNSSMCFYSPQIYWMAQGSFMERHLSSIVFNILPKAYIFLSVLTHKFTWTKTIYSFALCLRGSYYSAVTGFCGNWVNRWNLASSLGEISFSRAALATCGYYIFQEKVKMTLKFPTLSCKLIFLFFCLIPRSPCLERGSVCTGGGPQGVKDTLGVVCF